MTPFRPLAIVASLAVVLLASLQSLPAAEVGPKPVDEIRKAAEKGDVRSQIELATAYLNGERVPKDNAEGIKWLQKAAEQGDASAQKVVGDAYSEGVGVSKNVSEAVKWYLKAAEHGLVIAQIRLGKMYLEGEGVPRDHDGAVNWFRKAAERADARLIAREHDYDGIPKFAVDVLAKLSEGTDEDEAIAEWDLGNLYRDGSGIPKDQTEAVKWYHRAAERGTPEMQRQLGIFYETGKGVPQDYGQAFKWYRRAAERGDALAQSSLGILYSHGQGVPKDEAEAVKWWRMAAEQGNIVAQLYLGAMYQGGTGVPKDATEAAKWYRKAAEQGDDYAQANLAFRYQTGEGVPKDYVEAAKWHRKAAEQGFAMAQGGLGFLYHYGNGVTKDLGEATKWFRKAAEQGFANSQYMLGVAYRDGEGVIKDYVEAYKWLNLCAGAGDDIAKDNLAKLELLMSPGQIAEGQRLAREFRPRSGADKVAGESEKSGAVARRSGSGFFITDDGFLVTNAHVVKEANRITLTTSRGTVGAAVVKLDLANDLALLKAEGPRTPLPLSASRGVRLGATVATLGFPNVSLQGFAPKLAKGEIAALSGAHDDPKHFQISVPVQPGNSGGALVDERGNVVGVVSAKLDAETALTTSGALPENVNYAVKSSFLLGFLESVPDVSAKLKEPNASQRKFEDIAESLGQSAALILVY